jgi:hypothetical protein
VRITEATASTLMGELVLEGMESEQD